MPSATLSQSSPLSRRWTTPPLVLLCLFALIWGVANGLSPDRGLTPRAEAISGLLHPILSAWWVVADAQTRGRRLFYDYDTFVFFAWMVVVPVYLFKTRGVRAFLTIGIFVGMWLASFLVGWAIGLWRGDLWAGDQP